MPIDNVIAGQFIDPDWGNDVANGLNTAWTICTSASRPGSPVEGAQIYETDTNRTLQYTGTVWMIMNEPWQSFTPTLTQNVGVTFTTSRSQYRRSGEGVEWEFFLVCTSAGSGAGHAATLTLPVTATSGSAGVHGAGMIYDSSTTTRYHGIWEPFTATTIQLGVDGVNPANWGINPTIALASGDQLRGHIFYRYTPA